MNYRQLRKNKKITIAKLSEETSLESSKIKLIERGLVTPSVTEQQILNFYFNQANGNQVSPCSIDIETVKPIIGEGYVTHKDDNSKIYTPLKKNIPNKLKVLDIFCGVGGLSYGFEQTNKFVTIGGIDLLDDRVQTFRKNHPYAVGFKNDINKLSPQDIEENIISRPDIIVGGAPCQGFSSIRPFRTMSENDARNNLYEAYRLGVR